MQFLTDEEIERLAEIERERDRLKQEVRNACWARKNILERGRQRKFRAK